MKALITALLLACTAAAVVAQDPGQMPVELQNSAPAPIATEPADIRNLVDDFLASKGWNEGVNVKGDKRFQIAVGVATVNAAAGSGDFNSARINAFGRAMLAAKKTLAEFYGSDIQTTASSTYKEGGFPEEIAEANSAPSLLEKATILAHAKLDALLKAEGVNTPAEATEEQIRNAVATEEFREFTQTAARSTIAGLQAYKVIEAKADGHSCKLAVIAIHSELLGRMASVLSGRPLSLPAKTPKKPIIDQVPKDTDVLLATMGVQQRIDENGNLVLLAYGQAAPRTASDRSIDAAYNKARTQAMGLLRSFAGESAYVATALLNAETSQEFDDESRAYANESAYEEKISTVAEKMNIAGIATVKRWQAQHPLSDGKPIVGTVVSWSPDSAALAKDAVGDMMVEDPGAPGTSGKYMNKGESADDDGF